MYCTYESDVISHVESHIHCCSPIADCHFTPLHKNDAFKVDSTSLQNPTLNIKKVLCVRTYSCMHRGVGRICETLSLEALAVTASHPR